MVNAARATSVERDGGFKAVREERIVAKYGYMLVF